MSISDAARRFLQAEHPEPRYLPPEDLAGWRAGIDAASARSAAQLLPDLPKMPVTLADRDIAGVRVYEATPKSPAGPGRALYIHGGAFVFDTGPVVGFWTAFEAMRTGMRLLGPDYRTPPEHPFPTPVDDVLSVYRAVAAKGPVGLIAASSGAAVALSACFKARAEGLPLPKCLVLLFPLTDVAEAGDTLKTNVGVDVVLRRPLPEPISLYAGGHDRLDPALSPVYGDFRGFPPCLIISGTRDLLLSDAVRVHRAMRSCGVTADLNIWEAAPHGGFGYAAPEDHQMAMTMRSFLQHHLGAKR